MIRSIIGTIIVIALLYIGWNVWKRMSPEARKEVSTLAKEQGKSLVQKVVRKGREVKAHKNKTGGLFKMFSLAKEIVNKKDGSQMVLVEAGEFTMGSEDAAATGNPQKKMSLPAFYIDRYEVTNAQWSQFLGDSKYEWKGSWVKPVTSGWLFKKTVLQPMPAYDKTLAQYPVVNVSAADAQAYAKWAGKRLPTEAEWEKAARGPAGRVYPWGNDWSPTRCNLADTEDKYLLTAPVGAFADGVSPCGAANMAGNVAEWTLGPSAPVLRGGSWKDSKAQARCTYRSVPSSSDVRYTNVGFRCAKNP